jgi:hypothetical protein
MRASIKFIETQLRPTRAGAIFSIVTNTSLKLIAFKFEAVAEFEEPGAARAALASFQ